MFDKSDGCPVGLSLKVAGLTLVERGIRTLLRAGMKRVLVILPEGVAEDQRPASRPGDGRVHFALWGEAEAARILRGDAYLLVRGEWVCHHSALKQLVAQGLGRRDLVVLGTPAQAAKGPASLTAGEREVGACLCRAAALPAEELIGGGGLADPRSSRLVPLDTAAAGAPVQGELWCRVSDRHSARRAENMLFSQVTKATSGTVARWLNVRLSIPLSKVLVRTGVSPNVLSIALVLLPALGAALLIAEPTSYARIAAAGLLWQLASMLDGCDGEVARVKLAETRLGAWFDTIVDNVSYVCGFAGLAVGVKHLHPATDLPVMAGLTGLSALLLTLGMMYLHAAKRGRGSLQHYLGDVVQEARRGGADWVTRFVVRFGFVAKRDFLALAIALMLVAGQVEVAFWGLVALFHLAVIAVAATLLRLNGEEVPAGSLRVPLAGRATAPAPTARGGP